MAPVLSSNWKSLQAILKKTPQLSSIEAKKRKALEPSERTKDSIAKRRRLEDNTLKTRSIAEAKGAATKKKTMGGMGSSPIVESAEDDTPLPRNAPSASLALWAEDNDISAKDLAEAYGGNLKDTTIQGARADKINGGLSTDVDIGKYIAIDCEMVGVGGVEDRSVLARVSIVNFHGTQVYDSFVRPMEFVTDWRTHVSGVSTKNMATAREFDEVQKDVAEILKGRILIGHAIKNDLEAMILSHPKRDIRDTSKFSGFRKYSNGRTPSLKKLSKEILGVDIQGGEHSSIEDARATILLFRKHKSAFDIEHAKLNPPHSGASSKSKPKKKKKGKR
ncbi:c02583ef-fe2f-4d2c-9c1f-1260441d05c1 [Sclerotinia trifoliorum]|uniref:RNA exonuclease 4 n=1 Tax=Sclerotinia trifoliorum TaxID=28548 RepID=A0A8H2VYM3_9HELO|nr:c02583ef-fe2f-4d2c-9c1f-1260441d05c1 [Sclerotinia trifoliorum]